MEAALQKIAVRFTQEALQAELASARQVYVTLSPADPKALSSVEQAIRNMGPDGSLQPLREYLIRVSLPRDSVWLSFCKLRTNQAHF